MTPGTKEADNAIEMLTDTMYASTQYWTVRPPRSQMAQLAIIALLELGLLDGEDKVPVKNPTVTKMWVCQFDGPNDLCEQGKMTEKHQKICGEFWLHPVGGG